MDPSADTTIFYPEADETPLPGGFYQLDHFVEIVSTLKLFFRPREDVLASGNNFIYYVEGNPRMWVAPICFVLIGGNVDSVWENDTYLMWEVGKAPDFILEIGYPGASVKDLDDARDLYASSGYPGSTVNDLDDARDLYASLGVVEYWQFDPSGGDHYGAPLVGETLVDGEYHKMDMFHRADGSVWGHSPVLNLELHWQEGRLRFYDLARHRWLESMTEMIARIEADKAMTARIRAEARAQAVARAESAESRAEVRRSTRLAEARLAELRRLRAR